MRTSSWQLSSLQTTNNKPQQALRSKCPMSLLNSGSKISRFGLGTLLVLKAGTLCLAYWQRGGNTSILDKVCFSGSNLLMSLSALQSKRGSVMHSKNFLFSSSVPPLCTSQGGRSLKSTLLGVLLVCFFWTALPRCVYKQDLICGSSWHSRRQEEGLFLRNSRHPERQPGGWINVINWLYKACLDAKVPIVIVWITIYGHIYCQWSSCTSI